MFWIECAGRDRAGILGDTAHAVGLRLSGRLEHNRAALHAFCSEHRCLLIFDHITVDEIDLFAASGKTSFIFTAPSPSPPQRSAEETANLFSSWTKNPDECSLALADAQSHIRAFAAGGHAEAAIQLGATGLAFLLHSGRLAEAYELIETLLKTAGTANDLNAIRRLTWEQSWILEHWGERSSSPEAAPYRHMVRQLTLNFTA